MILTLADYNDSHGFSNDMEQSWRWWEVAAAEHVCPIFSWRATSKHCSHIICSAGANIHTFLCSCTSKWHILGRLLSSITWLLQIHFGSFCLALWHFGWYPEFAYQAGTEHVTADGGTVYVVTAGRNDAIATFAITNTSVLSNAVRPKLHQVQNMREHQW